jgi:hypothetical protein
MTLFRTKIDIPKSKFKLSYNTKVVLIGSCFSDNIGSRLKTYKFPVEHNPFGVLYNPVSIKTNLEILINKKLFSESDLYYYNDQWLSFNHYSAFSHTDKKECLRQINERIENASEFLSKSSYLFITFGTALVYEFRETGKIVANCHKLPANAFKRYLLDLGDIVKDYSGFYKKLKAFNPGIKTVLTVSPIRHWKDGAEMNQVSKSTLLLLIYELRKKFPEIDYYPSYEILMDELRDYRFYADDMLHLSEVAVDYIWNSFVSTYIDEKSKVIISEIEKLNKAINHRPFNINSKAYQEFVNTHLKYIKTLEKKYPLLDFSKEKDFFISKLTGNS